TYNQYNQNNPLNLTSVCLENCTDTRENDYFEEENDSSSYNNNNGLVQQLQPPLIVKNIQDLNNNNKKQLLMNIQNNTTLYENIKEKSRESFLLSDYVTRYAYNPNAANLNPKNISFLWSYNTGSPVVANNSDFTMRNMPKNTARDIKGSFAPGP